VLRRKSAERRCLEGVSRNEETLQPTVYLNKLPDAFAPDARVLVTDPMLATGARKRLAVAAGAAPDGLCVQVVRCAPVWTRS
jgi:uracil phosphoribosyltransferase